MLDQAFLQEETPHARNDPDYFRRAWLRATYRACMQMKARTRLHFYWLISNNVVIGGGVHIDKASAHTSLVASRVNVFLANQNIPFQATQ